MLKPGYKLTDLGALPEEWEVSQLGPLLLRKPDYGINAAAVSYSSLLPAYLRITDISETGEFIKEGRASVNHPAVDNYFLSENDIVLARTGASTGKSYLYNPKDGRLVYAGFLIRVKTDPQKLDARFLKFQLQTAKYWQWVTVTSVRSGQPGINGNEYAQLQIPLPSLHEQKAIADALSTVDTLLTSQRELLAKKRGLKLATQQSLLSGKRRLPGFSGKWEELSLIDFVRLSKKRMNPRVTTESYRCIEMEHIAPESGTLLSFTDSKLQASIKSVFEPGDVLFGKLRPYLRKYYSADFNGVCSTEFWVIKPLENSVSGYIYQLVQSGQFVEAANQTTGTKMPRANWSDMRELTFFLPALAEQRAIATILSDMDAEIEALAAQLAKTQALKQGMMQDLLTGTIRLTAGAAAPSSHTPI
jgi:type I restriction enzyme S subunit